MSVYDELFQLQLRLKQNKVNQQRKRDEVKRLCQSYENQVYHLLYLLYNFSNHIWYHLNEQNEFIINNENMVLSNELPQYSKSTNSYSNIFSNIANIPTEPEKEMRLNDFVEISNKLNKLSKNLNIFLKSSSTDTALPFHFSLESFLLVLTSFNFFWSLESADLFTLFVKDLDSNDALKFLQCLIIHPSIQVYFTTSLKPIFYKISNIFETPNTDLKQALIDSLQEFSPLIPDFLKKIFGELKISNKEKSEIFYRIFLRNYMINFSAFGIFNSEIMLFHKDQILSLIDTLDNYFITAQKETNDQISSEIFFGTLFSSSHSISIIPNEERLMNVSKNYCPITLVDKRSLDLIHSQNSDTSQTENEKAPFQIRQALAHIPPTPIFFVPHSPVQPHLSTHLGSKLSSDSAVNIASRILLRSDLIHIESTENKSEMNSNHAKEPKANDKINDDNENSIPIVAIESPSMNPFIYFEKIVDLSFSRVADPQVEVDLDKLEPLVSNMTLEELCQLIENELSMIEISSNNAADDDSLIYNDFDQEEDIVSTLTSATSAIDPLQRISLYSTQFSLISKMCNFINSQISASTNAANFLLINKFVSKYFERNRPAKNIHEPEIFLSYYKNAFDEMLNINTQNESMGSSLNENSTSNGNLKLNNTTSINDMNNKISYSTNNIRQMFTSNSNLISNSNSDFNNRSKVWANIQPDYITHRNFHSCLSFKLELLNSVKKDEKVINEANKMKLFLIKNREKLIDSQHHKFLDIYVKEPNRLQYFNEEFKIAFSSSMSFIRIDHIHQAYQVLIGLLQMQGMDEIGADQIIPFAMVSTVMLMTSSDMPSEYANELTFTYTYLSRYIEPFISLYNILSHTQEYSLVQFLSTYQYLRQSMDEKS